MSGIGMQIWIKEEVYWNAETKQEVILASRGSALRSLP